MNKLDEVTVTVLPHGLPDVRTEIFTAKVPSSKFIVFQSNNGREVSLYDLLNAYDVIGDLRANLTDTSDVLSRLEFPDMTGK